MSRMMMRQAETTADTVETYCGSDAVRSSLHLDGASIPTLVEHDNRVVVDASESQSDEGHYHEERAQTLPSTLSVSLVEEVEQTIFEAFAPIARTHKILVFLRWADQPEACTELLDFIIHYVPEFCKTKGAYDLDGHYTSTLRYMSSHPAFKEVLKEYNSVDLKDLIRPVLLACATELLSYFVKDDDPRIEDVQELRAIYGQDSLFTSLSILQWQTLLKVYNTTVLARLLLPLQRNTMIVLKAAGMCASIWNSCFNSGNLGSIVRCCRAILRHLTGTYTPTPKPSSPKPKPVRSSRPYKKRVSKAVSKVPILAVDSLDSTVTSPPTSLEGMGRSGFGAGFGSGNAGSAPGPLDLHHPIMSLNNITDIFSFDDYYVVEGHFSIITNKNRGAEGGNTVGLTGMPAGGLGAGFDAGGMGGVFQASPSPGMMMAPLPMMDYSFSPGLVDGGQGARQASLYAGMGLGNTDHIPPPTTAASGDSSNKCAVCKIHDVHLENLCLWCMLYHKHQNSHLPVLPPTLATPTLPPPTLRNSVSIQSALNNNVQVLQNVPASYTGNKRGLGGQGYWGIGTGGLGGQHVQGVESEMMPYGGYEESSEKRLRAEESD